MLLRDDCGPRQRCTRCSGSNMPSLRALGFVASPKGVESEETGARIAWNFVLGQVDGEGVLGYLRCVCRGVEAESQGQRGRQRRRASGLAVFFLVGVEGRERGGQSHRGKPNTGERGDCGWGMRYDALTGRVGGRPLASSNGHRSSLLRECATTSPRAVRRTTWHAAARPSRDTVTLAGARCCGARRGLARPAQRQRQATPRGAADAPPGCREPKAA